MQKNRITQSVIVGSTTLISAAIWAGLKNFLFVDNSDWLWPLIGFFVLLIFLSLNWLIAKSKPILLVTLFFILITFFFSFGFKWEYLAILLVAFFLFFVGSQRAIHEKRARVKLQTGRILKRGLPFVLTGLALLIATAYYFSPLAMTGQNEIVIPRPIFDVVVDPILKQLGDKFPMPELIHSMGISFGGDIKDDLYQQLNHKINEQSQAYIQYFTLGLAISLFLALKAISIPFMWLVILLSWGVFKLLVILGAIKVHEQAVLKEVIEV